MKPLQQKELEKHNRIINNLKETSLIIGCRYKTTWQSNPRMSFKLMQVNGSISTLASGKGKFQTATSSLRFINNKNNQELAIRALPHHIVSL